MQAMIAAESKSLITVEVVPTDALPRPVVGKKRQRTVDRSTMNFYDIDLDALKAQLENDLAEEGGRLYLLDNARQLQMTIYTMCGGGELGKNAANRPGLFVAIDDRTHNLPYHNDIILQSVKVLATYCEVLGLDPNNLNDRPTYELFEGAAHRPNSFRSFPHAGPF